MSKRIALAMAALAVALGLVGLLLMGCDEAAERRAELSGDYSEIAETEAWE